MSVEDYDHRWEPLAEIHFGKDDDENYIYCVCSRVFLRDGLKPYITDKEEESDVEEQVVQEVSSQSHVHFSSEASEKYKYEKEETASCYCSASHTDNCCSTDEHDPALNLMEPVLQPSDSGADLTYQEYHADLDKSETMEQDEPPDPNIPIENYLSEDTWDKFWANNGERLIWASWISKYSDYINPAYLQDNNDLVEETNISRDYSADQLYKENNEVEVRERSMSYDSKVNPYKKAKSMSLEKSDKILESTCNKDDNWLPVRKRSISEHDRIISPRTLASDSMTNVTKMTLSSYEVTSSRVTSDSSPTEDYSISSASDDQNEQTRIANIDDNSEIPIEEMDTDQYWQFLWKQHFGEQYASHYAKYIEELNKQQSKIKEKASKAQAKSMEEVENQIKDIRINEKPNKPKRKKRSSNKYLGSVGLLLQNLIKEESDKTEPVDAGDETNKDQNSATEGKETINIEVKNEKQCSTNFDPCKKEENDDEDPPDEKPVNLKRSHEMDYEEMASEKIKSTFDMMGLFVHPEATIKGQLVYRKKLSRLRPPWLTRFASRKKTYFDDDGFPCSFEQGKPNESQDEADMQTDNDSPRTNLKTEDQPPIEEDNHSDDILQSKKDSQQCVIDNEEKEALNSSISDVLDADKNSNEDEADDKDAACEINMSKRRRRRRRRSLPDDVVMPPEIVADPKLKKYWKKRHSLFFKFDSGIRLDVESWFSVTPEKVAHHIAERCRCDLVVDAFCGAGGNTIQLAMTCERVIAIDIDPVKIEMARHNCQVYGVADRVEFVVGDLFSVAHRLVADVVFLSPPWGGPDYTHNNHYDLETMLEPKPASELLDVAQTITNNVALYVPRNSRTDQLVSLARTSGAVEIEQNFLGKRFVALTAYYGDLVNYDY